jgi:hypothetical protein
MSWYDFSHAQAHKAFSASTAVLALAISGCMATPANGPQLPSHTSPVTLNGLTGQPNSKVEIFATDYCANTDVRVTAPGVPNQHMSSSNPMVFKNATATGDMSGFPWSATYPSITGDSCRHWTPYGCSFADWGPNQGSLKLKARITDPSGQVSDAMVFGEAEGESNVINCVKAKQRNAALAGQTLSQVDAALLCADIDKQADVETRNHSATWAVDFSGMTIEDTNETGFWPIPDGDEPYNPVIMGFRGLLKTNATLDVRWVNTLEARDLDQGQVYTLDDRLGRVHFRDVDTLSVGEWLGCDPTTVRIMVSEIVQALDLANKPEPTPADLLRALAFFNSFRCDLNQTPKEITVIGYALQAIEHDATQVGLAKSAVNSEKDEKRAEYQVQLRNVGGQLAAVRSAYREVIQFCNNTRDPAGNYSLDCITRFRSVKPQLPTGESLKITAGVLQALGAIGADILGWIIAGGDNDDAIGGASVGMYIAIDNDFMTLLTRFAREAGVAIPADMSLLGPKTLTITSQNSDTRYVTRGRVTNYTNDLKTNMLRSERERNAGRCPWTPPAESVNTGVNM